MKRHRSSTSSLSCLPLPGTAQDAISTVGAYLSARGAAILLLLAVTGCGGEEPIALAVADVGYIEAELVGLSDSRRALLQDLTAYALALSEGRTAEAVEPEIEVALGDRTHQLLEAQRWLDSLGIDEAALRERYLARPEWELTVRHLIVMSARYESDAQRDAAREKAVRALERIRAGEPFPEVAAEVSEEPGAEGRQGLLLPGREGAWVDEFWSAASALEVGGISEVVETQYGFHVLLLEGREVVPFDEARAEFVLRVAQAQGLRPTTSAEARRPAEVEFAPDVRTATAPAAVLAEWEGGRVTWADLLSRAAAEGRVEWEALLAGDAATRSTLLDLELAEQAAMGRAEGAGLAVDAGWLDALRRERAQEFETPGAQLGIPPGLPLSQVTERALAALGAPGQNAQLAHDRIRAWRGLLDRVYGYSDPNNPETSPVPTP